MPFRTFRRGCSGGHSGISVTILFCLIATSGVLQAAPFGTYDSYGIWYDRDGVDPSQALSWGAVNGGTYNTQGI
jgi:hypothetical protein